MKTAMNKSIMPMNKTFQRVAEAAAGILTTDSELKTNYKKGLEETEAELKAASEAKDAAEDIESFDLAREREARAEEKKKFFKRQLDKLKFEARIPEDTYNGYVQEVKDEVEKAAADFRKTAAAAMAEIVKAKKEYMATITEADNVLEALDNKAFVLQTKHRYHEDLRSGEGGKGVVCVARYEDEGEWRQHAIRFSKGYNPKGFNLAVVDDATSAAWIAADQIKEQ